MRLALLLPALATAAVSAAPAQSSRPAPAVTADNVLAIRSVVGGEQHEWAPDGASIMFQSSLGGSSGLWSVGAEGGFPTRLAPNLGLVPYQANYLPQWSPSGDWIAYAVSLRCWRAVGSLGIHSPSGSLSRRSKAIVSAQLITK